MPHRIPEIGWQDLGGHKEGQSAHPHLKASDKPQPDLSSLWVRKSLKELLIHPPEYTFLTYAAGHGDYLLKPAWPNPSRTSASTV